MGEELKARILEILGPNAKAGEVGALVEYVEGGCTQICILFGVGPKEMVSKSQMDQEIDNILFQVAKERVEAYGRDLLDSMSLWDKQDLKLTQEQEQEYELQKEQIWTNALDYFRKRDQE